MQLSATLPKIWVLIVSRENSRVTYQLDGKTLRNLEPYPLPGWIPDLKIRTARWNPWLLASMIQAVLVINTQGKPRLTKFYQSLPVDKQQEVIRSVYTALSSRAEKLCSFVEAEEIFGADTKLVYKHFATLYFVFVVDSGESELGILDLIQVFVETLDRCFKDVCELDIVHNFNKVHTILDEIIMGGQVVETNPVEVMKAVQDILKLERTVDPAPIVVKPQGRR